MLPSKLFLYICFQQTMNGAFQEAMRSTNSFSLIQKTFISSEGKDSLSEEAHMLMERLKVSWAEMWKQHLCDVIWKYLSRIIYLFFCSLVLLACSFCLSRLQLSIFAIKNTCFLKTQLNLKYLTYARRISQENPRW